MRDIVIGNIKPGDLVWCVAEQGGKWIHHLAIVDEVRPPSAYVFYAKMQPDGTGHGVSGSWRDLGSMFPTRQDAQAECERRNRPTVALGSWWQCPMMQPYKVVKSDGAVVTMRSENGFWEFNVGVAGLLRDAKQLRGK